MWNKENIDEIWEKHLDSTKPNTPEGFYKLTWENKLKEMNDTEKNELIIRLLTTIELKNDILYKLEQKNKRRQQWK